MTLKYFIDGYSKRNMLRKSRLYYDFPNLTFIFSLLWQDSIFTHYSKPSNGIKIKRKISSFRITDTIPFLFSHNNHGYLRHNTN